MTYDPAALFEVLAQRGIEYVLIGGWAVNAHGYRRFTGDVDICPAPGADNLARLAALVRELDGQQLGLDEFAPGELPGDPTDPDSLAEGGNFRLSTRLGTLDLMQWVAGIDAEQTYAELARDAVEADLDGAVVRVCSLDRLLAMKRAAGRPGRSTSTPRSCSGWRQETTSSGRASRRRTSSASTAALESSSSMRRSAFGTRSWLSTP